MKEITKSYKKLVFKFKKKINLDNRLSEYKSLDDLFNFFGTDKGSSVIDPYTYGSKEILGHGFAKFYEKNLMKYRTKIFNLLEIGTWEGASTAAFASYFPYSKIYGIDKNFRFKYKSSRICFNHCDIRNQNDIKNLRKNIKNITFKVIIDDASHMLSDMIYSLNFFLKYLESGGFFVIEDFNAPIYFKALNDCDGKEIFMEEIFRHIIKRKQFKSNILSKDDQKFLFENISDIKIYKGKTDISDIAFLKKS